LSYPAARQTDKQSDGQVHKGRNKTSLAKSTSCAGGRQNMPPPPASWPLTFWPWKWCPSHMWHGLHLCQF